jgi:hypothetical protein
MKRRKHKKFIKKKTLEQEGITIKYELIRDVENLKEGNYLVI